MYIYIVSVCVCVDACGATCLDIEFKLRSSY